MRVRDALVPFQRPSARGVVQELVSKLTPEVDEEAEDDDVAAAIPPEVCSAGLWTGP